MTTTPSCGSMIKPEMLHSLIDDVVQDALRQIGKLEICSCLQKEVHKNELCTIYTTLEGSYRLHFVFCAERSLMHRITENMLEEPVADQEDIVEYMKEFVNIVCGHIVASVFYKTKASARFHCPQFQEGWYLPADVNTDTMIITCYTDKYRESAMFLHDKLMLVKEKI